MLKQLLREIVKTKPKVQKDAPNAKVPKGASENTGVTV